MNHSLADPLRKSTERQSLSGPEARLFWARLRPGPYKRIVPLPRARPMRATCGAAPHAPRGAAPQSPCRGPGAAKPGLPFPPSNPGHATLPRSLQRVPPGPLRAPAGEGHLRRRNLRARPALPAPARALSNPPSAGPAPGPCEPPPPGDGPAPGLLAPSTIHRLPATEILRLGPPGMLVASMASKSLDPSQPSPGHASLGKGGTGPTRGTPNFRAGPALLTPTHSTAGLLHRQALCSPRPRRPHSHAPPQVFRYPSPNPAHAIIHTPAFYC